MESALYRTLEAVARQDRRSVPQMAKHLLADALKQRLEGRAALDDTVAENIGALAQAGGAFDWLGDEPDLYDDSLGRPV